MTDSLSISWMISDRTAFATFLNETLASSPLTNAWVIASPIRSNACVPKFWSSCQEFWSNWFCERSSAEARTAAR